MTYPNIVCPTALEPLHSRARALLSELASRFPSVAQWSEERRRGLLQTAIGSDYLVEQIQRTPESFVALADSGALERLYQVGEIRRLLQERLHACDSEDSLGQHLRRFRNEQQLRIIWRHLLHLATLQESCRDLSELADASVDLAYHWLHQDCARLYGQPLGQSSGQPQAMVILGMGKLGAGELNLSSDIDLIFAYPEDGETDGARRSLDNQTFFTRLGQRLIKALDTRTQEGFVFRTDLRLRPYGAGAPLVFSFAALQRYYQEQGRDWERYAMIKARVVAGDQRAGGGLLEMLQPFVYRPYLDFSAIQALRGMKAAIQEQVQSKGMQDNIKLGAGGIREVEFIAQVFQLIHGGHDFALQQRPLLNILATLESRGYLAPTMVTELREGYAFLRQVEHCLQACQDQQTHELPQDAMGQARLAFNMGFADWPSFLLQLGHWRSLIDGHFQQLIADPNQATSNHQSERNQEWRGVWLGQNNRPAAVQQLTQAGFSQPERLVGLLEQFRDSPQVRGLQGVGRERLDQFLPRLLAEALHDEAPDLVVERLLPLLEAVIRRSAYLVLFSEYPSALPRLVKLCGASPWIAEQVTRYPFLLNELCDQQRLFTPPQAKELTSRLRELLSPIPAEDLEQQMEALRHFKLAHSFRVAASELNGSLPLMKVSDYLTWLAESILEQVLELAWKYVTARHGFPQRVDGSRCELDFLIVGYGKLGGIELGYGSDLDLVFIHDADPQAETDGARPLDGAQFYTRLAQRINHLLTTQTLSGPLYPVDLRLRPSGSAGLLVTSLSAYARYQRQEAWTWEHQALVRARPLVGCPRVAQAFNEVRTRVLGEQRDVEQLRQDVSEMRRKMRHSLGTQKTDGGTLPQSFEPGARFDLKQDAGGIVDIEFMVQYAVLAWSYRCPALLAFTDNIRILDALSDTGLLANQDARLLQDIYKVYRAAQHRQLLQNQPQNLVETAFSEERHAILALWDKLGLN